MGPLARESPCRSVISVLKRNTFCVFLFMYYIKCVLPCDDPLRRSKRVASLHLVIIIIIVIPIVISSTGVIPMSLSQSLTRLNLHPNTYTQLKKSVILGTCSTVRNFLDYK